MRRWRARLGLAGACVATASLLAGCDSLFGIQTTREIDAHPPYFDAAPDAPPACPALGTVPRFSTLQRSVAPSQECKSYTEASDRDLGIALCRVPMDNFFVHEGSAGAATLTPSTGVTLPNSHTLFDEELRVAPEGDSLLVRVYDYLAVTYTFETFQRQPDGTWTLASSTTFPTGYTQTSSMTRGPTRHILLVDDAGNGVLELASDVPGTWTQVDAFTAADLGAGSFRWPMMTADGKRLVFYGDVAGGYRMLYSDRPDLSHRFGPAQILPDIPQGIVNGFMTEACARLYFTSIFTIYYVQQL